MSAPRCDSLPDVLRESAHRFAGRPALVADGITLDYAALDERVDRLAGRLLAAGVHPGDRVGLCVQRGALPLVVSAALMRVGCAYVPLDVRHPIERLRHIVGDAGLSVTAADEPGAATVAGLSLSTVPVGAADLAPGPATAQVPPAAGPRAESVAYVMYTSGSTGRPKGVEVTHANVVSMLAGALPLLDVGPGEVWPLQHAHGFDVSVWEMWAAMATGATLIAVPAPVAADPERLAELLLRSRPTRLHIVPSVFGHLAEVVEEEGLHIALGTVVFCGEPVSYAAMRRWNATAPGPPPRWRNVYGITETTVYNTHHLFSAEEIEQAAPATAIGVPYPTSPALVLDEAAQPVPPGVTGEIALGGPQVAGGYLGRPELTAERFVRLSGRPGRWYRTGDLGTADAAGRLRYVGRRDEQVKLRGHRVELGEIDHVLRDLPWVRDAAVLVEASARAEPLLTAYLVPVAGLADDDRRLLARLHRSVAERLPVHMIPARAVRVDRLPLNPNGKTDRRSLAALGAGTPPTD